jgi:transcriptional regulator with XRE-family HTH domain
LPSLATIAIAPLTYREPNNQNPVLGSGGMSPAQARGARGLLGWTQAELVRRSSVTQKTITDFERGLTKLQRRTLGALIETFEAAGIEFIKRGVRMRASPKRTRT